MPNTTSYDVTSSDSPFAGYNISHNETTVYHSGMGNVFILHLLLQLLHVILLPASLIMCIIALVVYGRTIRKPTVYFLRNLAIADLLIPVIMIVTIFGAIFGADGCVVFLAQTFYLYAGAVSVNAVLVLVLEQLFKFLFPAREVFTKVRLALLFLALWTIPAFLLFVVPHIHLYIEYTQSQFSKGVHVSFCRYVRHESTPFQMVLHIWLCYCSLCLIAIAAVYVYTYLIVRKVLSGPTSRISREDEVETRTRMKMLKLTVWLLVCLIVFWGPLLVAWIVFAAHAQSDRSRINVILLIQFIALFTLLNPIVDPIIVLLRMRDVKKGWRVVCCCCCDKCKKKSRGNFPDESVTYTKTMLEQVDLPEM